MHKDYSMLCLSTLSVTKFLFGDDLQTELTHIKATSKIGATASSPITSGQANYPSSGSCQGHHYYGRAPQFSRPTTYKLQSNSRRHYNHIPGSVNIIADQEPRKISSDLEWVLDLKIYKEAVKLCDFTPNIDLLASRLNK